MLIGKDYLLRDDLYEEDKTLPIQLLTGPYKDVILRYTTVSIKEMENDQAKMLFDYDLLEMGDHTETSLRKDVKFTHHVGLVLNTMILETLEEKNATGDNDPTEFVEE
jgi:hypothetical protein